jgi:hypothetical protein
MVNSARSLVQQVDTMRAFGRRELDNPMAAGSLSLRTSVHAGQRTPCEKECQDECSKYPDPVYISCYRSCVRDKC